MTTGKIMQRPRRFDVSTEAERIGFRVVELWLGSEAVWAWHRAGESAGPHFVTKGDAYAWMEEQLHTGAVSDLRSSEASSS